MNHNVQLNCPHCDHPQDKQIELKPACEAGHFPIGIRTCQKEIGGCGGEYAIYARSIIEVKTKKVMEG